VIRTAFHPLRSFFSRSRACWLSSARIDEKGADLVTRTNPADGSAIARQITSAIICWLFSLLASHKVIAADAIPGEQWCDRPISAIVFEGNRVTQDEVLRRELLQKVGTQCSLDDIIDGIQNNLDLGLFKSVLRWGAQLRWDNFLGRLHQVRLTYEKRQQENGQGRSGHVRSVDYTVPRFFGSRFGLALSLDQISYNTELSQDDIVFGEAVRQSHKAELRIARWAGDSTGVRGLSYFAGAGFEQRSYELSSGMLGPFSGGDNVSLLAGFEVNRIHQSSFSRSGHQYGLTFRVFDEAFGSDFSYSQLDAFGRWYLPLRNPQKNINVQLRLGFSTLAPFGARNYSIGGGQVLRGMRTGETTGDILTVANIEYLSGLFAYPAWRWVVFTDIGNVYLKDDVNLLKQNVRGGVGIRWKLQELTNTDIRLDVAWDPRRTKLTPYISTSLTF